MNRGPAFRLQDVSKRYGTRWALSRLSFELPAGRALLLTGHNGSGKSTLLNVLASAIRPTRGAVEVMGVDARVDAAALRRRVGLVSHQSFLYEDLSAEENLLVLGRLLGIEDPRAEAQRCLRRMGLETRARHLVRSFSAGMRKRLALARLLLKQPELVLLDEPFGELDPAGIATVEGLIRELHGSGVTVVLSTHQVEQGLALCDTRLHLSEGRAAAA